MNSLSRLRLGVTASLVLIALAGTAYADGQYFKDGPVINVASIRTVDGHFDDYMQWLSTTWKRQQEAAKKAGLITRYQILLGQPQGPHDPDIYLVTEFKNWAALDGLGGKMDAVSSEIEGSVEQANRAQVDRAKIRTVLGSKTLQVAELK